MRGGGGGGVFTSRSAAEIFTTSLCAAGTDVGSIGSFIKVKRVANNAAAAAANTSPASRNSLRSEVFRSNLLPQSHLLYDRR